MTADLPAIWADVRSQQYSGIKLYSAIGKVLVEKSFSEEVADVVNIFYLSIPILDRELKTVDAEHRRLKLVMDIARSVGYFDIFVSLEENNCRSNQSILNSQTQGDGYEKISYRCFAVDRFWSGDFSIRNGASCLPLHR